MEDNSVLVRGAAFSVIIASIQLISISNKELSVYLLGPAIIYEVTREVLSDATSLGNGLILVSYLVYTSSPPFLLALARKMGALRKTLKLAAVPSGLLFLLLGYEYLQTQGGLGLVIMFALTFGVPIFLLPILLSVVVLTEYYSPKEKIVEMLKR